MAQKHATRVRETGSVTGPIERVLDILSLPFLAILVVPLAGCAVRLLHDGVTELIWRMIRAPGIVTAPFGGTRQKILRVRVVVLTAGRSRNLIAGPVADDATIRSAFQAARAILIDRYGIEAVMTGISPAPLLSPTSCHSPRHGLPALAADAELTGAYYQLAQLTAAPYGSFRRLLGYGAPLTVFVAMHDPEKALRIGWFSARDYIVLPENHLSDLGAGMIRACGLGLVDQRDTPGRATRAWLQNSRFCTGF